MGKIGSLINKFCYVMMQTFFFPLNEVLIFIYKNRCKKRSVLHISFMGHTEVTNVRMLRKLGLKADFLAVGRIINQYPADFHHCYTGPKFFLFLSEFKIFWQLIAHYAIIHSYYMVMISNSGWEWRVLKRLGRKIVVNYAGCEIRDPELNLKLHPKFNLCEDCDYNRRLCTGERVMQKRMLTKKYADLFLVTTPDMLDFVPEAVHMPFFTPVIQPDSKPVSVGVKKKYKICHATNHPGLEGTEFIKSAIAELQSRGYAIEFDFISGVSFETAMSRIQDADFTIGKMKMGYFANFQIESLCLGVPAITYIRPEFVNEEIRNSGLIITDLDHLVQTIAYYIDNPDAYKAKKTLTRASVHSLHDNEKIGRNLIGHYEKLLGV